MVWGWETEAELGVLDFTGGGEIQLVAQDWFIWGMWRLNINMSKSLLVSICVEFLESLAIDSGFSLLTINVFQTNIG